MTIKDMETKTGLTAKSIRYYETNLPAVGVDVKYNTEGTAETIAAGGFDHVVIAVGGTPKETLLPTEPGCIPVYTTTQVIRGEVFPGKRVVVIGGSFVGCETARLLARKGSLSPEQLFHLTVNRAESGERREMLVNTSARQVTLIEKGPKIGFGYESGVGWPALGELSRLGVAMLKNTRVTAIGAGGILCQVTDKEGKVSTRTIDCDTVVVASGSRPDDTLAKAVEALGIPVSLIGNAHRLGRAIAAIKEGAEIGCTL